MRTVRLLPLALLIAGCGGSSTKTVAETNTVTGTTTVAAPATTPTTTKAAASSSSSDGLGKWFKSGGIRLKVLHVKASRFLHYEGGTDSDQTPNGSARTIKAKQHGHYVYVETRLANKTSQGID